MSRSIAVLTSLAAVGAAAAIGGSYRPQRRREAAWYASLRKPSFTPPGPVIGAVWGVLETLLCVTGYRLLRARRGASRTTALACWAATLGGLAGFTPIFFGQKKLGASTAVTAAMLASTSATAVSASRTDPVAALTITPLVLWSAFALLLSEEVWRRN